jgi:hypothetical protein
MGREEAGIILIRAFVPLLMLLFHSSGFAWDVQVVGESKVTLQASGAGTIAQVSGTLTDEINRGVAHRAVQVSIISLAGGARVERTVLTDTRGAFAVSEEMPPGRYSAEVVFTDDPHLKGANAHTELSLVPTPLVLQLIVPPLAVGSNQPILVYGRAKAGVTPVQTEGFVTINGQPQGKIALDRAGRGSMDLRRLLVPGTNRIVMTVPGSAYRDAAQVSQVFRWEKSLEVEATLEEGIKRLSRGYTISGTVSGSSQPVPDVRVQTIFFPVESAPDDPRRPVTVFTQTDSNGRFGGFAGDIRLGGGVWRGVARVIPAVGDPVEAAAAPLAVTQTNSQNILNIFGGLVLLIGFGFMSYRGVLVVAGQWQTWKQGRQKRRQREQAFDVEERIVPRFLDEPEGKNASRRDVAGLVWDEWRLKPVPGCTITAKQGAIELAVTSDGLGRFRFDGIVDGAWDLRVDCPGFVRGNLTLSVPHDGRLAAMRLDIIAVPLKVRRLYQAAMEAVRGDDPWGRLSPREVEAEVQARLSINLDLPENASLIDVLSEITDAVEESYFSGRVYDEAFWRETRELVIAWREGKGEAT